MGNQRTVRAAPLTRATRALLLLTALIGCGGHRNSSVSPVAYFPRAAEYPIARDSIAVRFARLLHAAGEAPLDALSTGGSFRVATTDAWWQSAVIHRLDPAGSGGRITTIIYGKGAVYRRWTREVSDTAWDYWQRQFAGESLFVREGIGPSQYDLDGGYQLSESAMAGHHQVFMLHGADTGRTVSWLCYLSGGPC